MFEREREREMGGGGGYRQRQRYKVREEENKIERWIRQMKTRHIKEKRRIPS